MSEHDINWLYYYYNIYKNTQCSPVQFLSENRTNLMVWLPFSSQPVKSLQNVFWIKLYLKTSLHSTMSYLSSFSCFPRTALPHPELRDPHHICGFHTGRPAPCSLPSYPHLPQPRPCTPCSVVPSPSSHHVCGVGAGSLPQGWEWGAGGPSRQTPGERCGGRVEPGHWTELPGGPGYLPTLWPQEDHPLWWGQDVRYAHLYPHTIKYLFLVEWDDEHNTWRSAHMQARVEDNSL